MTDETQDSESQRAARGGLMSLVGAACSAGLGFLFVMLAARLLGDSGAGVVFQLIAVFSIATSLAKFGMDSAAVWLLPRLRPAELRAGVAAILGIAVVSAAVGGVAVAVWAYAWSGDGGEFGEALRLAAWFVPFGALSLVALGVLRGLGDLKAYLLIGSIAQPALRPVLAWLFVTLGGGAVAVSLGWLIPVAVTTVAATATVAVIVWRRTRGVRAVKSRNVGPLLRFALPRTLSAGLEQCVMWIDVLLVGAIAGVAAAGVYGAASRFIAAGMIVDTAIRTVVATRFSALIHADRRAELQALYRDAATWLVLFATPIFVMLAAFAPVILGFLGSEFIAGAPALAVLCGGAVVTLLAGNVHSVLLMSGRSGWAAFNKAVVVAVNVGANLVLIPRLGIVGAAIAWSLCVMLDGALAAAQIHRFVGVSPQLRAVGYALVPPLVCFGLPSIAAIAWLGQSVGALLLAGALGTALFAAWCWRDRSRLRLTSFAKIARD